MTDIESKMVFAVAPDGTGDGAPLVMLGIPTGAWDYMSDGKTHTFDLTKIGLPVKLMLYGAADHTSAMKVLEGHLSEQGVAYLDERRTDFSIAPEPTAGKEQDAKSS